MHERMVGSFAASFAERHAAGGDWRAPRVVHRPITFLINELSFAECGGSFCLPHLQNTPVAGCTRGATRSGGTPLILFLRT